MPLSSTATSSNRLIGAEMGNYVDTLVTKASDQRKSFERRWYDNNFFDDGYHFRFYSRSQNKIVDLTDKSTIYNPLRAIPKTSRQIRGICNLLLAADPTPVVYPERVSPAKYPPVTGIDPVTQQEIQTPNPEYAEAIEEAKRRAKFAGHWLEEEFKEQGMIDKLALMVILAAKNGVSFMEIWPDAHREKIRTQVFDAFDIYVQGTVNDLTDSPFLIKAAPRLIAEIKADKRFDKKLLEKISPDNREASSDIKNAYMKARYGGVNNPEASARIIEKEAFIKEYLDEENTARINRQENAKEVLEGRGEGDIVIRHTFVEGNITVLDEYISLPDYPFVDFRFEPGPIYSVPLIERFIPANKSLDLVISRIERYLHTMVVGAWKKKIGEQFDISNTPGGQIIEYSSTPPEQMQIASIPNFVFLFMKYLESLVEEQGVTTTTLGKIPAGVRANAAIESLKESEYSNLIIPSRRLSSTVKEIAKKFLDIANKYYITPKTYFAGGSDGGYFDVIGASALDKRTQLKVETSPDVIPLRDDYKVEIEVQKGMAYTREAQKEAAKQLGDYLVQLAQLGMVNPEVVKVYLEKLLETYGFGATSEIMDALESMPQQQQISDEQMQQMKVAIAEVFSDMMEQGAFPTSEQRVEEGKVATAEAIADITKGGGE